MRPASAERAGRGAGAPWPLLLGFGLFLVAMIYLLAASFTRRSAPTFAPSAEGRTRAVGWEQTGDTLTVDARDGREWRYVSLERGRVVSRADAAGWELAVRRYNVIARSDSSAIGRWYRYSLLTHLLESIGKSYVVPAQGGRAFRVQILSYYCPGLNAGCVTLRYAPLTAE